MNTEYWNKVEDLIFPPSFNLFVINTMFLVYDFNMFAKY